MESFIFFSIPNREAQVDLNIDDFNRISARVPLIANFKPAGEYLMEDLYNIGGEIASEKPNHVYIQIKPWLLTHVQDSRLC